MNQFFISFYTPSFDDSGIFHVIEHCIMAGSDDSNVKNISFSNIVGNINAATGSNFTIFMCESLSDTFFIFLVKNLIKFIFNPSFLTDKSIFNREKIIVHNEMLLMSEKQKFYLKACDFFISGGIPDKVLEIEHDKIVEIYKKYYIDSFESGNINIYISGKLKNEILEIFKSEISSILYSKKNKILIQKELQKINIKSFIPVNSFINSCVGIWEIDGKYINTIKKILNEKKYGFSLLTGKEKLILIGEYMKNNLSEMYYDNSNLFDKVFPNINIHDKIEIDNKNRSKMGMELSGLTSHDNLIFNTYNSCKYEKIESDLYVNIYYVYNETSMNEIIEERERELYNDDNIYNFDLLHYLKTNKCNIVKPLKISVYNENIPKMLCVKLPNIINIKFSNQEFNEMKKEYDNIINDISTKIKSFENYKNSFINKKNVNTKPNISTNFTPSLQNGLSYFKIMIPASETSFFNRPILIILSELIKIYILYPIHRLQYNIYTLAIEPKDNFLLCVGSCEEKFLREIFYSHIYILKKIFLLENFKENLFYIKFNILKLYYGYDDNDFMATIKLKYLREKRDMVNEILKSLELLKSSDEEIIEKIEKIVSYIG